MIRGEKITMSKIMAVFEKIKLVEKVNNEATEASSVSNVNTEEAVVKEKKLPKAEQHAEKTDREKVNPNNESGHVAKKLGYDEDKYMSVADIYAESGIGESNVNTIFMLEKFINALPENLPSEIKKQSVINILEASNTNLNTLISDGEKRLNALNAFSKEYYNSTTDVIEEYKSEIAKLKNLISSYEEKIKLKQSMLFEQNNVIKFETERISSTINFFRNN